MDRVQRTYAHTALTATDPLADLDPQVKRAILLMPPTFRERLKLAPWRSRQHRQMIIFDIIAERRLAYELTHGELLKSRSNEHQRVDAAAPSQGEAPLSPYYQHRLALHADTMAHLYGLRRDQNEQDLKTNPEARQDASRRRALLELQIERTRLDLKEMHILRNLDASADLAESKDGLLKQRQRHRNR